MVPGRGQTGAAEDAEEIGFADVESLFEECGVSLGQGAALMAEFAGPLMDRRAFWGGLGTGPVDAEERVDVGVASEVSDDGADGVDMELKPLGELASGCAFVEVGSADLVAALWRGVWLLEQACEFLGASHRSWVPMRQVSG